MIVCTRCSHANQDDDQFCGNCGEFLEWAGERIVVSAPEPEPAAADASAAVGPGPVDPAPAQPAPVQPVPVPPEKPAVRRPAPVPAARPEETVRPDDLVCPSCGTGNDRERSFCRRCGTALAADAPPPAEVSWWRKVFDRQPKVHAAGERPMRDKKGRRR